MIHNRNPSAALVSAVTTSDQFDTSQWNSICDLTLTLKQARKADNGVWIRIDEAQCRKAVAVFMHRLDRAVYGHAASRFGKRIKVLPILERAQLGRWHIHAAIELPAHISPTRFDELIRQCWSKVDWADDRIFFRDNANRGWIDYMLKPWQKSGFETWLDCIVWECLHNPIVGA
jgi:hypothetical protein